MEQQVNLFAIIGQLYINNLVITEENTKLKNQCRAETIKKYEKHEKEDEADESDK